MHIHSVGHWSSSPLSPGRPPRPHRCPSSWNLLSWQEGTMACCPVKTCRRQRRGWWGLQRGCTGSQGHLHIVGPTGRCQPPDWPPPHRWSSQASLWCMKYWVKLVELRIKKNYQVSRDFLNFVLLISNGVYIHLILHTRYISVSMM